MKTLIPLLAAFSIITASCQNDTVIETKDRFIVANRLAADSDTLPLNRIVYGVTIPKKNGVEQRAVLEQALNKLMGMGVPINDEERQAFWSQNGAWRTIEPQVIKFLKDLNSEDLMGPAKEHLSQLQLLSMLKDASFQKQDLTNMEVYVSWLKESGAAHPGLMYLCLSKLKSFWPQQKVNECANQQISVSQLQQNREKPGYLRTRELYKNNEGFLPPKEDFFNRRIAEITYRMYEEKEYFLPKLKSLIPQK